MAFGKKEKIITDEWIWVDGYKGTDKDMKCHDFQYELNKQFDMPEDVKIKKCESGFHLCRDLDDVFKYYHIGIGHRFFEVKALVRKKDYEDYGKLIESGLLAIRNDKLVSKSIILTRELTTDEILEAGDVRDLDQWLTIHKAIAREVNVVDKLEGLGYSRPFAEYLVSDCKYNIAKAVGSQKDISMDMKVAYIMRGDK